MLSIDSKGLPHPLPPGVVAEPTSAGMCVTFSRDGGSSHDRRIWISGIVQFGFVFVVLGAFLWIPGALTKTPMLWLLLFAAAALSGGYSAIKSRSRLVKRQSSPAKLQLTANRLIIDEPSFNFNNRNRIVDIVPMHIEYDLADISGFAVASTDDVSAFENALQIHLTNRMHNYHLKRRPADQLQWACQWLSAAKNPQQHKSARGISSFVYDQNGPRSG